ncbi:hypothetical protein N9Y17_04890 [Gammaproteobacteria bacterium]|nr:hypothetical protein [Gammaproteobacteria bacterium]
MLKKTLLLASCLSAVCFAAVETKNLPVQIELVEATESQKLTANITAGGAINQVTLKEFISMPTQVGTMTVNEATSLSLQNGFGLTSDSNTTPFTYIDVMVKVGDDSNSCDYTLVNGTCYAKLRAGGEARVFEPRSTHYFGNWSKSYDIFMMLMPNSSFPGKAGETWRGNLSFTTQAAVHDSNKSGTLIRKIHD